MPSLPTVKPGKIILNGENPFIWLYETEGGEKSTEASVWTINYSEKGAGHALFIKSELTEDQWRIYSDNTEMVRWLQSTVQGMLNPDTADHTIPVIIAEFKHCGDVNDNWTQIIKSKEDEIVMNWYKMGEPLLVQDEQVSEPGRPYGVNAVMIPSQGASLNFNGQMAKGSIYPMELDGHAFSTAALAFSENWRQEK
jgi:hypothetical protein